LCVLKWDTIHCPSVVYIIEIYRTYGLLISC
jgi:hypothetical protein